MTTLKLLSNKESKDKLKFISCLDNRGNVFCEIYADGKIKVCGEDSEIFASELHQVTLVAQHFQIFYDNIKEMITLGYAVI